MEEFVETSKALELSLHKGRNHQQISVIDLEPITEENDMELISEHLEIAALQRRFKQFSKKYTPNTSPSTSSSGPTSQGNRRSRGKKPHNYTGTIFCYRCRRYGKHHARNCPVPKQALAMMSEDEPHPANGRYQEICQMDETPSFEAYRYQTLAEAEVTPLRSNNQIQ
jgi:hypothetical protein